MKLMSVILSLLLAASCSSSKQQTAAPAPLSPQEQVAALENSCKAAGPAIKERQKAQSLYERLGKREKIKVFSTKLFDSHRNNKDIGHMFANTNKGPFIKNVTDFLVVGSGGKGKYVGRDMKAVHHNFKITHADFLAAGGDVQAVMKELNYGENEIQEVVCALVSFVPMVVTN